MRVLSLFWTNAVRLQVCAASRDPRSVPRGGEPLPKILPRKLFVGARRGGGSHVGRGSEAVWERGAVRGLRVRGRADDNRSWPCSIDGHDERHGDDLVGEQGRRCVCRVLALDSEHGCERRGLRRLMCIFILGWGRPIEG